MSNLQEALECSRIALDHFQSGQWEKGRKWLTQAIGYLEQEVEGDE